MMYFCRNHLSWSTQYEKACDSSAIFFLKINLKFALADSCPAPLTYSFGFLWTSWGSSWEEFPIAALGPQGLPDPGGLE